MNKNNANIKVKHIAQHTVRALRCVLTDAAHQLPDAQPEHIAQYLSADPNALVTAHAEDDFECAIEMDASVEQGRKLRPYVERILRFVLGSGAVAGEEVPDSEYKPERKRDVSVRVGGSGTRILVRTEPDARFQFDFMLPTSALTFITLLDGDFILDRLTECAAHVRKQNRHNLLANMIGFHRHSLRTSANASSGWFMDVQDHTDLMADLRSVAEAPNYREIVAEFVSMLEYRTVHSLFADSTPLVLDVSAAKQRYMAEDTGNLRDAWCVMAQCEPLAFLYEFAQIHAPLVENDALMNANVFEVDIELDEKICPKEFCVFFNTDNGGAPEAADEEQDEQSDADDGLEPFEPVFDEDGSAINVGQNMQTMMDEHLARDE